MVKNLSAVQENWVQSLGWEDPLEEGMTTHSSILAWRILWRKHYSSFSVMPRHRESRNTSHLQMSDRKKKKGTGTSLVVQWRGLHDPMQAARVQPWSEDWVPHAATKARCSQINFLNKSLRCKNHFFFKNGQISLFPFFPILLTS